MKHEKQKMNTLLEIFDVLGGKGDPYLVDLFLGFLKAGFGGLHRGVRHCSQRRRRREEEEEAAACENERAEGMENLERVFRAKVSTNL